MKNQDKMETRKEIKIKDIDSREIVIKRIDTKRAKKRKLLGTGAGFCLEHCIYEGILHCKDFLKRVKYFVVLKEVQVEGKDKGELINEGCFVTASFYE